MMCVLVSHPSLLPREQREIRLLTLSYFSLFVNGDHEQATIDNYLVVLSARRTVRRPDRGQAFLARTLAFASFKARTLPNTSPWLFFTVQSLLESPMKNTPVGKKRYRGNSVSVSFVFVNVNF